MEKPIPKKAVFTEDVSGSRKRKSKKAEEEKISARIRMQYCQLHGKNPTHSTADCFKLNRRKQQAKEFNAIQRHERQKKAQILYKVTRFRARHEGDSKLKTQRNTQQPTRVDRIAKESVKGKPTLFGRT